MLINWDIRACADPELLSRMQNAADLCTLTEGIHVPCSVSICLCDDETIAGINSKFRGINRSTDVLSFPSVSYPANKTAGVCASLIKAEYDDETGTCFLGDIFISVPHLKQQAAEYGHSELREGVYLMVHGICHLMGYDHLEQKDKKKMRSMEEKIMSAVSISRQTNTCCQPQSELGRGIE